uniref:Uncharacterized protein n=1 Tax=Rhizobium rhizogenes TaxID=359 RepID=A0A7S4ZTW1_RHIRH|nr:hypothetical protein pC6.5b_338 [Rhizobium rhizogenes]
MLVKSRALLRNFSRKCRFLSDYHLMFDPLIQVKDGQVRQQGVLLTGQAM